MPKPKGRNRKARREAAAAAAASSPATAAATTAEAGSENLVAPGKEQQRRARQRQEQLQHKGAGPSKDDSATAASPGENFSVPEGNCVGKGGRESGGVCGDRRKSSDCCTSHSAAVPRQQWSKACPTCALSRRLYALRAI